jgi:glutamate-1-semialdehyde 2,1-aminomutase
MTLAAELSDQADAGSGPKAVQELVASSNEVTYAETRAVVAGGGSSNMRNAGIPVPLVVSSAAGCRITDVEGTELLDVNMGYGPHLFGYGDQDVLGAIAEQMTHASMTGLPHVLDHQAGELITALIPSVEQVRFANSGTEAVASAVRLARMVTGRDLIITFEGHYHGWSETLLRTPASAKERAEGIRRPASGARGMIPEAHANTLELRFNDVESLEKVFASHGDRIAAVILEPVCANAGVVAPADGFLELVMAGARRNGALVIFDEVITGFRLAAGGAQEYYGVSPDITVVSKALGGGYPVAAFGANREIMEPLANNTAFHAGVYAGSHLAMRAVVATLTKILHTTQMYDVLEQRTADLERKLRGVFADSNLPTRIVRVGSIISVAVLTEPFEGDDRIDCAVDKIDFDTNRQLQIECQTRGLYFHPNPLEPWFLSTAHSPSDVDEAVEVVAAAVDAISTGGARQI